MIAASESGRDRALVRFFYLTAARPREAARLSLGDVGETSVRLRGKGDTVRDVEIPVGLAADLRALCSPPADESSPVFKSYRGARLHERSLRYIIARIADDAGIRHVSPYHLRHSHGSHALDRGAPAHVVQKCMGHSSLATTGVYCHPAPGANSAAYLEG